MTSRIFRATANFAVLTALVAASATHAQEWGTIKGKFVYDKAVEPAAIQVTKDVEYCSQHKQVDESVITGEGNALANVFVYIAPARGKAVSIHPDDNAAAADPVKLTNKGCRFEPHAVVLWTKHPLEVGNEDPGIGHNTNLQLVLNPGFNETITSDKPITKNFTKSEPIPMRVVCNVHPWMNAYILIRDNPYMAVSGKDGTFEIKNAPAGKNKYAFWHEAKGNLKSLTVGGKKSDRKGQLELDVPAGKTLDLGEIKVTASILGK